MCASDLPEVPEENEIQKTLSAIGAKCCPSREYLHAMQGDMSVIKSTPNPLECVLVAQTHTWHTQQTMAYDCKDSFSFYSHLSHARL